LVKLDAQKMSVGALPAEPEHRLVALKGWELAAAGQVTAAAT